MKTLEQWKESRKPFDEFANAGDIVSEEIVNYFLEVVPPRTHRPNCVQCGEPIDIVNGKNTDTTFVCTSGQ